MNVENHLVIELLGTCRWWEMAEGLSEPASLPLRGIGKDCAANHLNIKSLIDLTCQTVADMIKGKTPEEIRKILNIKNDFTPEEEEEVKRENAWAV
ncbi:hypothetical protein MTR67_045033 [Solanum verrucosum]|uniref:SKP1 component dimerisation domain-containing protein n=1 Tax=Solanum verrucosum TaxID=315347 RepID=A0AAF0ZVT6_SOLVR|nr:hypothetical protein MTR67_045033 [Solanum verrucosum]